MSRRSAVAALLSASLAVVGVAAAESFTPDSAVALAMARNRDVIAARLELKAAEVERITARLYPNPVLSYTLGNLVLGSGNPQAPANIRPSFGDQTVHTLALTEVIDVWAKRSARIRAADRGIDHQRLLLEDALRDIAYAVRAAFVEVLREQSESQLARETRARYEETVRLTRARRAAGEISESELKKVELEGLRYENELIEADLQLDLARQRLSALLAMRSPAELPGELSEDKLERPSLSVEALVQRALEQRPDVRAVRADRQRAEASVGAARREAFPDLSLGISYTHSEFTISGDNPNSLALSLSFPVPIFDRNQGAIAKARLEIARADNDAARVELQVRQEVADAVRRTTRSRTLVEIYEGGMLDRAETALKVAEKSYKAGAVSLLELLEAQRTYLEVRGAYLKVMHDYRQAIVDVNHAVGGNSN